MLTKPHRAIPFESVDPVLTPQGHKIRPLVDGSLNGNVPGMRICGGGLDVPPGYTANVHKHPKSDVIVLVFDCGEEGALTLCGSELEYEVRQLRGDLLPIEKGWSHTVVNLSLTTAIRAYEFRSSETVLRDNPLLPHLQPIADQRGRELLVDLHGPEAVARFQATMAKQVR
jgi:uncharacterized RmlC-like cupin family protein